MYGPLWTNHDRLIPFVSPAHFLRPEASPPWQQSPAEAFLRCRLFWLRWTKTPEVWVFDCNSWFWYFLDFWMNPKYHPILNQWNDLIIRNCRALAASFRHHLTALVAQLTEVADELVENCPPNSQFVHGVPSMCVTMRNVRNCETLGSDICKGQSGVPVPWKNWCFDTNNYHQLGLYQILMICAIRISYGIPIGLGKPSTLG